jgi:general secretion pathway protein N
MNSLRGRLMLAGIAAYLLFLLVTLPATVLSTQLARHGVTSTSTSGSVWNGQMNGLQAGVLNLGNVEWHMRFLPLLTGRLAADINLTQSDGFAQSRVGVGFTGNITFTDLSATLPLQSIVGSGGLPGGWVGTAQARFSELVFKDAWPVAAHGTLDVIDLSGPARQPSNLGAYRLTFPADATVSADALLGKLEALEGAVVDVTGTLKFAAGRSYLLDTMVAARGNAPQNIAQGMQYLGSPDAQGRRPFSVSGTL